MQRGKKLKSVDESESKKLSAITAALLKWYTANARDLPWRRTQDPYAIWVSEIMLQQTQVKTVIPYWNRWMRELPTIVSLAKAPSEKIHKLWEGLGYYTRVRNMQKAAIEIIERWGGRFPESFDDVLALPGIGRYTAGAICSIAFNQPTAILDGNVIRVLTRLFRITGNPRDKDINEQLWELAGALVRGSARKDSCSHLNQSLMELGALICTPRQPTCLLCPVRKLCSAFAAGCVEQLPSLAERAAATARRFIAFVVERERKYLVRQRPVGIVNGHLWEFPNVEILNDSGDLTKACHPFQANLSAKPLCRIRHSITRYRITLDAFHATVCGDAEGVWLSHSELQKLAFTSAHKKILQHLKSSAI